MAEWSVYMEGRSEIKVISARTPKETSDKIKFLTWGRLSKTPDVNPTNCTSKTSKNKPTSAIGSDVEKMKCFCPLRRGSYRREGRKEGRKEGR